MEDMHPIFKVPYSEISNVPGPVDWENSSHGIDYDHDRFLVLTYAIFGDQRQFKLTTKIRLMTETEIIFSKLRGHDVEAVRRAYEFPKEPISSIPPPVKRRWWMFWRK